MSVQFSTPLTFKGTSKKDDDVATKIEKKTEAASAGIKAAGDSVNDLTKTTMASATGVAGTFALLKGKVAPAINWFYDNVTPKEGKPGEFVRENLNKTKVGVVAGAAVVVGAGIAIYKGVKIHNAKKAEAEAKAEEKEKLEIEAKAKAEAEAKVKAEEKVKDEPPADADEDFDADDDE